MKKDSDYIYLDHAAATPMIPEVLEAMQPFWQQYSGNPQAVHAAGSDAQAVISKAREQIAAVLEVRASELIFTSGATEANSLALLGTTRAYEDEVGVTPTILLSAIAHPSVLQITKSHPNTVTTHILAVNSDGEIDTSALASTEFSPNTAVVSVEHGNSEVGTLQPIHLLAKHTSAGKYPLLHVDASQTGLYYDIRPHRLGVDLLTVNAHKLGGPKGIGLLWVKSGTPLAPVFIANSNRQVGDYQHLRPGTPPTPLIVGMAEAMVTAQRNHAENNRQVKALQEYCISQLEEQFPQIRLNGSREKRVPHNVNITFPDIDHDFLATKLSTRGIIVSTTSACQAESGGSAVLALLSAENPRGLRISLSTETSRADIDKLVLELAELL